MADPVAGNPIYPDNIPVVTVGVGNDKLDTCHIHVQIEGVTKVIVHVVDKEVASIEQP